VHLFQKLGFSSARIPKQKDVDFSPFGQSARCVGHTFFNPAEQLSQESEFDLIRFLNARCKTFDQNFHVVWSLCKLVEFCNLVFRKSSVFRIDLFNDTVLASFHQGEGHNTDISLHEGFGDPLSVPLSFAVHIVYSNQFHPVSRLHSVHIIFDNMHEQVLCGFSLRQVFRVFLQFDVL